MELSPVYPFPVFSKHFFSGPREDVIFPEKSFLSGSARQTNFAGYFKLNCTPCLRTFPKHLLPLAMNYRCPASRGSIFVLGTKTFKPGYAADAAKHPSVLNAPLSAPPVHVAKNASRIARRISTRYHHCSSFWHSPLLLAVACWECC